MMGTLCYHQKVNMHVYSLKLLNDYSWFMSIFLQGNHTAAVIKGQEDYETLKSSCSRIFNVVNIIVKNGFITIAGKNFLVDIFLGGDYKVKTLQNPISEPYTHMYIKVSSQRVN